MSIIIETIDYESILKLFDADFPKVTHLDVTYCDMKRLKKNFIERFPKLENFRVRCCRLETIEENAFSNTKYLVELDLNEKRFHVNKNRVS